MKKSLVLFLMIGICAVTIFAQNSESSLFKVSVGGGGSVNGNFSSWKVDPQIPGNLYRYNDTHLSVGPHIFFDLKFLELCIGLPLGWLNGDDTMSANPNFPAQTLGLRGSAYFKMPFTVTSTDPLSVIVVKLALKLMSSILPSDTHLY